MIPVLLLTVVEFVFVFEVGVALGFGVAVGAGAAGGGETVTCAVAWEVTYPILTVAVIVQVVACVKLGAVKVVL